MHALLDLRLSPDMTCERLAPIAFYSHVGCYLQSGIGFCDIVNTGSNFQVLFEGLDLMDFTGRYGVEIVKQVSVLYNIT